MADPFYDRIREMTNGAPYRAVNESHITIADTYDDEPRKCPTCGVEFDPVELTGDARGRRRKYCSPACRRKADNAKAWRKNKSKIQRARGVLRPRKGKV